MKTRMSRKSAPPGAALAALVAMLAGCSGVTGAPEPPPSPSDSAATVSDQDLGKALVKLVFQGTGSRSQDGGACLVGAAKEKGISDAGLAYIVERDDDDIAAVAEGLRGVSATDAAILLSPELGDRFDACVDAVIPPASGGDGQAYPPPSPAAPLKDRQPDLRPLYPVAEGTSIGSPAQLTRGLVSMFGSYALDEAQRKTYEASGTCLADVVFKAGFSQEALRFMAGGAPIGTGSIADFLSSPEDKKLWQSKDFTAALVDCTTRPQPTSGTP
jgi:hypothetical protein